LSANAEHISTGFRKRLTTSETAINKTPAKRQNLFNGSVKLDFLGKEVNECSELILLTNYIELQAGVSDTDTVSIIDLHLAVDLAFIHIGTIYAAKIKQHPTTTVVDHLCVLT
jgi:hypothetical protein